MYDVIPRILNGESLHGYAAASVLCLLQEHGDFQETVDDLVSAAHAQGLSLRRADIVANLYAICGGDETAWRLLKSGLQHVNSVICNQLFKLEPINHAFA